MTPASLRARTPQRSWLALTAILGASVLASLDLFIVNLAFPQISSSFPATSPQALSWVLNAYLVTFAALLAPAGRLADHFGRRRVFQLGLAAFALGTVAASIAPGIEVLIAARAFQGAGAAVMVPTSLALLLSVTDESSHKRMISVWAAAGSVAAALGPVLGGVLADANWRWVFLIKIPFAVIALVGARALPRDVPTESRTPDLLGAGLLAVSIAALVTALSYWPEWIPGNPLLWAVLGGSAVALVLFVARSRIHPAPSIDLTVFRNAPFSAAVVGMAAFYLGFSIMLLGGALWTTNIWQWSSALTGLAYVAGPGTAVLSALLVGRSSLNARWFAVIGGALFVACGIMWAIAFTPESPNAWVLIAGLVLTGAAAGIGQTGFLAVGTTALPATEQATAAGVVNTARQVGAAIGVAVLIALVGAGLDPATYRHAWIVMAAAGALAALSPFIAPARSTQK